MQSHFQFTIIPTGSSRLVSIQYKNIYGPSDLESLVTLPPMVDVGLEIYRRRLKVGVAELGLEVVEGNAHIKGPNCVKMPQGVRSDDV